MAYELIQAAKRGVKVKILLDELIGHRDPALVAFMSTVHPNLELKHYNPSGGKVRPKKLDILKDAGIRFADMNQRMHNKMFIVDDRVAITGGRNYQNDYYDFSTGRVFRDRDIIVIGPVVSDMTSSFMEFWAYKLSFSSFDMNDVNRVIVKDKFPKYESRDQFNLGTLFDEMDKQASNVDFIAKTFVDRSYEVDSIRFIADPPGKNEKRGSTFILQLKTRTINCIVI